MVAISFLQKSTDQDPNYLAWWRALYHIRAKLHQLADWLHRISSVRSNLSRIGSFASWMRFMKSTSALSSWSCSAQVRRCWCYSIQPSHSLWSPFISPLLILASGRRIRLHGGQVLEFQAASLFPKNAGLIFRMDGWILTYGQGSLRSSSNIQLSARSLVLCFLRSCFCLLSWEKYWRQLCRT